MTELPPGRTARRLSWAHLPPALRADIEDRIGSRVVQATSRDSGFTPGFASVLTTQAGTRQFVKAASLTGQRPVADSYRAEARTLQRLPVAVPAPRPLWTIEGEWFALCLEYVDGREPTRPWRDADLSAALSALAAAAAPADPGLPTVAEEFADLSRCWDHVAATQPDLAHGAEAADLAVGFAEVSGGDHWVHTETRADSFLLRRDGSALVCDWSQPARGAGWIDAVHLLLGAWRDGAEVEAALAAYPWAVGVPPEHVDRLLALLAGFYAQVADAPAPATSPYLRHHQAQQRDAAWTWLSHRRGWV